MSSAICRAVFRRCSAAWTNTQGTCARWPASWRTRSHALTIMVLLENFESEGDSENAKVYLARAREGSERLGTIYGDGCCYLCRGSDRAQRAPAFDLAARRAAVGAVRWRLPAPGFSLRGWRRDPSKCMAVPSDVRLLEKLVERCRRFKHRWRDDYCEPRADASTAELSVANPGPSLRPILLLDRSIVMAVPRRERQRAALRTGPGHRAAHRRVSWRQRACRDPAGQFRRRVRRAPAPLIEIGEAVAPAADNWRQTVTRPHMSRYETSWS